jgi:hypothetical protein
MYFRSMYRHENVCKTFKLARATPFGFSILVLATTTLVWGVSGAPTASAAAAVPLNPTTLLPHPINLPTGPQTSAKDCPNPPDLSAPLPAGATISAPSLVPNGLASLVVGTQTYDLSGTCAYTLTLPSASSADTSSAGSVSKDSFSINFVDSGNDLYFPTGTAGPIDFSYNGRHCNTTAEIVTAYGFAIAEQELVSGYCTSNENDPSGTWGYADAANTAELWAGEAPEPSFNYDYQSAEAGTIFFGQFQECMENPAGQQSSYVCVWNNYGPLF